MQFQTRGGKLKQCELTLHWPEEMKFTATATNRVTAERMAAALACLKLKVTICFAFFFFLGFFFPQNYYSFAIIFDLSLHDV